MKKWVVLIIACLFTNILSQTNVLPQFSELKGMEDQQGNTHLFYRIYSSYSNDPFYDINNDIYHFDLVAAVDTLFLADYSHEDPAFSFFRVVKDYTFWNNDFAKYIFCGSIGSWEPGPYIKRFDNDYIILNYLCCEVNQIDISSSNASLIYSGGWLDNGSSLRSYDGGFNWDTFNESHKFISLSPFNDNILFAFDNNDDLVKSSDGGNSFYSVDTVGNYNWDKFLYDIDVNHIYRTTFEYPFNFLIVSANQGEAFSWQTKYSSDTEIFISIDESISGSIYLADKKNIFISTSYGNNFSLYKTLDRKIVGIYKKPNSDKLYAATEYCIYEITSNSITILKQLPAINDFQWYPLAIGNKWIYNNYREEFNPPGPKEFIGVGTMEVIGDTLLSNQKKYYQLKNEPLYWDIDTGFVRQDSLEGKLYLYLPGENWEVLYEDFSVQVGDTIWIDSAEYKTLISEEYFTLWGIGTYIKTYDYSYRFEGYELVKNIGMYYYDFTDSYAIYSNELKGCIINGVVYGDTSVVSVEDKNPELPTEFSLSQNYPNPFNPTTKIIFTIPQTNNPLLGGAGGGLVTLKVYDILGNEIATLVNEEKPAGEYEVDFDGSKFTSGIYFYQLKASAFVQTKKMVLLK